MRYTVVRCDECGKDEWLIFPAKSPEGWRKKITERRRGLGPMSQVRPKGSRAARLRCWAKQTASWLSVFFGICQGLTTGRLL